MNIQIINGTIRLTRSLREHIEQRIGLALGRYTERIRTVSVRLGPGALNGGKPEKLCRIEVGMKRSLKVEATHADVFSAVNQAVDHATRRVARIIAREVPAALPAATPRRTRRS